MSLRSESMSFALLQFEPLKIFWRAFDDTVFPSLLSLKKVERSLKLKTMNMARTSTLCLNQP